MQVRRGPDGEGVNAVECSTCHQGHNLVGLHMPPGAPDWHLPSAAMPMIWEGLTDRQLCELFKDPQRNGHRTPEQIAEHLHPPLVLWGWSLGDGRTPVPIPQDEFFAKVQEWAETRMGRKRSGMSSRDKRHNNARCSGLILITSHRTAHHYESPQAGIRSIPVIAGRAVP
jgi:hypothetical protein